MIPLPKWTVKSIGFDFDFGFGFCTRLANKHWYVLISEVRWTVLWREIWIEDSNSDTWSSNRWYSLFNFSYCCWFCSFIWRRSYSSCSERKNPKLFSNKNNSYLIFVQGIDFVQLMVEFLLVYLAENPF